MQKPRILIVGGGIVGLATGYQLAANYPQAQITILEKEPRLGGHQTGHNSGVLHCGLYYQPGSLKARLAVSGIQEMVRFCQKHQVDHDVCGKIVVATNSVEEDRLRKLEIRGRQNGLQGLQWLDRSAMRAIEPHVGGIAALRVPQEGIVDYPQVTETLGRLLESAGHEIHCGERVTILKQRGPEWLVQTPKQEYRADFLITCAGLHSDRVSQLAGETRRARIVPFRGEYYQLKPDREGLVRHLIYPVPDPEFPFLGVHFTRLIHGGIEAGPNAVLAFAREGYRKADVNLADLIDAMSYSGLWQFIRRYPRMTVDELRRSFSKKRFCESLQKLVPDVQEDDLAPGGTGVRAQAMSPEGTLIHDFRLIQRPNCLHVINAPSPAATASLAIGGEIVSQIRQQLD